MSVVASFYVFSKPEFEYYCEVAELMPHDPQKRAAIGMVTRRSLANIPGASKMKPPTPQELQERQDKLAEIGNYLSTKGGPYEYGWSGTVLNVLLEHLSKSSHIDLRNNAFDEQGPFTSFLLDRSIKDKYLAQLNPENFNQIQLASAYKRLTEQWFGIQRGSRLQFPEQGQAMLAGIKIIYNYLQLVNDQTVVMLYLQQ